MFSEDGGHTRLRAKSVSEYVSGLGRRLKPPLKIHLHELRHFAATHMVGSADPRTVAAQLGHDPTVLLEVYSHAVPERAREAAQSLAGVLAPSGGSLLELEPPSD